MAQIVTITNPLTGQPAQVDQLDHTAQQIDDAIARALPGGSIDTLLSGKAPAGYGLGETTPTTVSDPDTITKTGLYITSGDKLPSQLTYKGNCLIYHESYSSNYAFQEIKLLGATNGGSYKGTRVFRYKENGVWAEWEWENPPMNIGVEYRTTERYKGKPVYIKAVDTGALPNATFKSVAASFPNANAIVDYGGEAYQDADHFIPLPCLKYGVDSYNNEKGVQVTISNGYGITIATTTDFSSFTKSSVWVKYTKSTD